MIKAYVTKRVFTRARNYTYTRARVCVCKKNINKYVVYSRRFLVTNPVPVDAGLFAVGTVEVRR